MAQSKSDEEIATAKAASAARRAEARVGKIQEAENLKNQTARQMEAASLAIDKLRDEVVAVREKEAHRSALASHLSGFYDEVDKQARGKALVSATDLTVEGINEIVRDAKGIVDGDTYLDRVKEFVPAGDNPVYPDVLLKARAVKESLERFKHQLEAKRGRGEVMMREARTIQAATRYYIDNEEIPSKEQVEALLDGIRLSDVWFAEDAETGEEDFNFEKLDGCDLDAYFTVDAGA